MNVHFVVGKQMGRMKSVIGTRSLSRKRATSLSKFEKLNGCEMARRTKRVSGRVLSSHRSCSPKVTLIINHMKPNKMRRKKRENHLKLFWMILSSFLWLIFVQKMDETNKRRETNTQMTKLCMPILSAEDGNK